MFDDVIEYVTGASCEIRSTDNILVFLGKVRDFNGNSITIAESTGAEVPPVIFNTEFKFIIHPLNWGGKPPVVGVGAICGSTRHIWKMDQLTRYHFTEQRSSYRQQVNTPARALFVNPIYGHGAPSREEHFHRTSDCRILNISLGGAQFRSRERFQSGDWVLLMGAQLLPDEPPFTLTCQICWADRVSAREFLFGCRFTNLTEWEQDRLCGCIFRLQRLDIKNHRK